MLDSLSLKEKEKYEKIWQEPSYRVTSPGNNAAELFFSFFKNEMKEGDSIIDFGAGSGIVAIKFYEKKLKIDLVDIAANALDQAIYAMTLLLPDQVRFHEASLWQLPETLLPASFIYCMDVLEHIPEEKIDETLMGMSQRMKKGGVFQIFLEDEPFGDLIQDKLHLTIRESSWWKEKISRYFTIQKMYEVIPHVRIMLFLTPLQDHGANQKTK